MSCFVNFISGEFFLQDGRKPNGGGVVVLRTTWVTLLIMLGALVGWSLLRLGSTSPDSVHSLRVDIIALAPWATVVYGGVYLAFYARFAAQWSYLATLYNQIKQTEVTGVQDRQALAQWKAGFIEDALFLHLASKENIAGIIRAWAMESGEVRDAFIRYTPRGRARWDHVLNLTKSVK